MPIKLLHVLTGEVMASAGTLRDHWFTPRREPLRQAVREAQRDKHIRADIDADADAVLDLLFGPHPRTASFLRNHFAGREDVRPLATADAV
jgi:hypothetical protein